MTPMLIIKHITCGNFFYRLLQPLPLRKYHMDMQVCFPLVVIKRYKTLHTVPLLKFVCHTFQQIIMVIVNETFRQGNHQLPCLNALSIRAAFFKFFLITFDFLNNGVRKKKDSRQLNR